MNRRQMLKSSGVALLAAPAILALEGCPFTVAQAENEINVIVQETGAILAVAEPNAPWLGTFAQAAALLKADEAAWVKGGAVQDVINVLNDLGGVTSLISPLVPYAQLISVLVAGIDAALALLLPTAPAAPATPAVAHVSTENPFRGKASVKNAADSKKQWNAIVRANPALAKAAI